MRSIDVLNCHAEADFTFKVGGCALCPAEADTTFKVTASGKHPTHTPLLFLQNAGLSGSSQQRIYCQELQGLL